MIGNGESVWTSQWRNTRWCVVLWAAGNVGTWTAGTTLTVSGGTASMTLDGSGTHVQGSAVSLESTGGNVELTSSNEVIVSGGGIVSVSSAGDNVVLSGAMLDATSFSTVAVGTGGITTSVTVGEYIDLFVLRGIGQDGADGHENMGFINRVFDPILECHPQFSIFWGNNAAATVSASIDASNIVLGSALADTLVIGDPGDPLTTMDVYAGNVVFHGDVSVAGTIINPIPSDSRLKFDVRDFRDWIREVSPVASAVELVQHLRPVTYSWNEIGKRLVGHRAGDLDLGFLAQEVESLYPFATSTFAFEGESWRSLDYSRLTPLLVEAVKELAKVSGRSNFFDLVPQSCRSLFCESFRGKWCSVSKILPLVRCDHRRTSS